jgi:solute carrier family 29 (equilibrative nucleoside transporter), member 1/2/3
MPVFISNDFIYWTIGIVMSYSSGYLSSLAMMYAPRSQNNPLYQIKAGMMAAAMLITGIFAGILFSYVCPIIIQYELPKF